MIVGENYCLYVRFAANLDKIFPQTKFLPKINEISQILSENYGVTRSFSNSLRAAGLGSAMSATV